MEKLEEMGDLRDCLMMRLVAKAWHAAFKDYETGYDFVTDASLLQQLLDIKPNLESLELACVHQHMIKLNPLRTKHSLTSLILNGNTFQDSNRRSLQPLVKLSKLPPSLQLLSMHAVYADPAHFSKIVCTGLTDLSLSSQQNTTSDTVELLHHLPKLKVLI